MHHDAQQRNGTVGMRRNATISKGTDMLAKKRHCTVGKDERSSGIALQSTDGKAKDKQGADSLRVPREAMKWHCN